MTARDKMKAILARLAQIPFQQTKCLNVDVDEALSIITSAEELDFYYRKIVKGE